MILCVIRTLQLKRQRFTFRSHKSVARETTGVYAFWANNCCLYVGKSINISARALSASYE